MRHESIQHSKSTAKIPAATAAEMISALQRRGSVSAAARSLRTSPQLICAAIGTDATERYGTRRTCIEWSDNTNVERLIELVDEGLTNDQTAVAMESTVRAVQKAMTKHGIRRLGNAPGARVRECLCCDRQFSSTWIGNRMCPICNAEAVNHA